MSYKIHNSILLQNLMMNNKYDELNTTVCYEADMTYIHYSFNTRRRRSQYA